MKRYDYAIVGSGIAGLSAALPAQRHAGDGNPAAPRG